MTAKRPGRRLCALSVLAVGLALAATNPTPAAEDAKAYYKDKTLRFITMGGPGGGFDAYMRTLMPHIAKRLDVHILPINEPGAGGLRAMNRLIKEPPDGLSILLSFGETMIGAQIYGVSGVRYDVNELEWLGRVTHSPKVILIGPKTPFKTLAQAIETKGPVIWGGSGKTDGNSDYAAIISHALGLKAKIIGGYRGSRKMLHAVEQGELYAQVLTDESGHRGARRGNIRAIATLDRERSKLFPDVPTIYEVAKPSPEQSWWLDWRASMTGAGRLLVTAPGTPRDRVALLRSVIADVLRDPAFLADAKKRKLSIKPMSGAAVEAMVKKTMASIDKSRIAEVRRVVLEEFYSH